MAKNKLWLAVSIAAAFVALSDNASAKKFSVLHTFGKGHDGSEPLAGLVTDSSGSLYGTTEGGGAATGCHGFACGTVFKVAPDGSVNTLYSFQGGTDGAFPTSRLVVDKAGNLFGTTTSGGGSGCSGNGCGTVFKITPEGQESVLYSFTGGSDGQSPSAGVIADKKDNLYGTTQGGGGSGCPDGLGCGIVFKLSPTGAETILHTFTGGSDGGESQASLIIDKAGNLYGTTPYGGGSGCFGRGCGTVFKIDPDKSETILHKFTGTDGAFPQAELIEDTVGNLFSTTDGGGDFDSGTVFKIDTNKVTTVLYSFQDGSDGSFPKGGLIADKAGNFYGTTSAGGAECGCGTVFELSNAGVETILHAFGEKNNDGDAPFGGLVAIGKYLYGTSSHGGKNDDGTIFKLKKVAI